MNLSFRLAKCMLQTNVKRTKCMVSSNAAIPCTMNQPKKDIISITFQLMSIKVLFHFSANCVLSYCGNEAWTRIYALDFCFIWSSLRRIKKTGTQSKISIEWNGHRGSYDVKLNIFHHIFCNNNKNRWYRNCCLWKCIHQHIS